MQHHCDFCTFTSKVNAAHRDNPNWRYGQAAYNVLAELEPELAGEIRGTVLDPFHDSERVQEFLLWVERKLGAEEPAGRLRIPDMLWVEKQLGSDEPGTDTTVKDGEQYDDLTASLELSDLAPTLAEVAQQPRRYERPAFAGIFSGPSDMAETAKQVVRDDDQCNDCGDDGTPCRECPAVA